MDFVPDSVDQFVKIERGGAGKVPRNIRSAFERFPHVIEYDRVLVFISASERVVKIMQCTFSRIANERFHDAIALLFVGPNVHDVVAKTCLNAIGRNVQRRFV